MDISQKILSDIVVFNKYAKHIPELHRRETWEEICDRNMQMHIKRFPELRDTIENVYEQYVLTRKILPSMRSMQFAGKPIEISHSRVYNCAYVPMDNIIAFSEMMFLLLGGTGVGYSVQSRHVSKLPVITGPSSKTRRFLIGDSIEGWADTIKVLLKAYTQNKSEPVFDYRDIRPKGARLITSGGKAPGPDPLRLCVEHLRSILNGAIGRQLKTIEVHDMACHIADAVLAGGIRRAAMIAGFDCDDMDMLSCKSGMWWELNPQRGRANNSVILDRETITEAQFLNLWEKVKFSGAGEPGFYWTNDKDYFTNPCCVPGDQLVETDQGLKTVQSLVGVPFNAIIDGEAYHSAGFWSTGEKPVYQVTTARGYTFKATDDHKIMTADGEWVTVGELQTGDLVKINNTRTGVVTKRSEQDQLDFNRGYILGSVWGDGGHNPLKYPSYMQFWGDEQETMAQKVADMARSIGVSVYVTKNAHGDYTRVSSRSLTSFVQQYLEDSTKDIKPELMVANHHIQAGFISGAFDADGSCSGNTKGNGIQLQLAQSKYDDLVNIQRMANNLGIVTTVRKLNDAHQSLLPDGQGGMKLFDVKPQYRLDVGRDNVEMFAERVGFGQPSKQDRLETLIESKTKSAYRTNYSSQVTDISLVGIEEVFDCTVDVVHAFSCNGVVVHNCEISLRPFSFCNLTEVNVSDVSDQNDLNERVRAAAIIGTLQASYTNFHYLRDVWKETTESDALIGVGMTGIGSGAILGLDLEQAAEIVRQTNAEFASKIGINTAARTSTIKPSGTSSCVVGSSSGIHAWHNDYYIRRMRVGKNEALYNYLKTHFPTMVEDCAFKPHIEAVVSIPQKAPDGAILRTESAIDLLERVKKFNIEWVRKGHNRGPNFNNVSCTISLRESDWGPVGDWMWANREHYNGISVLPYDGGTYKQAPFEDCSKDVFDEMSKHLSAIDLTRVVEIDDNTDLSGELACAGGACIVT